MNLNPTHHRRFPWRPTRTGVGVMLAVLLVGGAGCATNKEIQRLEGDAAKLQLDLARTYVARGAYAAATPMVTSLVRAHPEDVEIVTLHAIILRETGLFAQAEGAFKRVIAKEPRFVPAHAGLALVYDLQRRLPEAEAAHRKALELAPDDAPGWNNLGFSLYLAERNDEAIEAFQKALSIAPDLVVAHNNLGFAYAKKGDWENARRCFLNVGGVKAEHLNVALAQRLKGPGEGVPVDEVVEPASESPSPRKKRFHSKKRGTP